MRVVIAGSRDIFDFDLVHSAIAQSGWIIDEVVSGGAKGVDLLGERWAREAGVPIKRFLPDWKQHGRYAGFLRNRDMARYGDAVVLVWDGISSGSRSMLYEAQSALKPVFEMILHPDGRITARLIPARPADVQAVPNPKSSQKKNPHL